MDFPNQQPPVEDLLPRRFGRRNRPDLTAIEKRKIVFYFLERCSEVNGVMVPARGTAVAAAIFFGIHKSTTSKIWKTASDNKHDPDIAYYKASPQRKGRCGNNQKYDYQELEIALTELPREVRMTTRSVAEHLGVSTTTVANMIKQQHMRRTSNTLKSFLTDYNKWMRLEYAVGQIDRTDDGMFADTFRGSYDEVHIDEKFFDITKKTATYYLGMNEVGPVRRVINKLHIVQVMFLVAVARPRYDVHGNCIFDGKIGCWPLIMQTRAQRRSQHRPAGAIVTTQLTVTKAIYKQFMFEKVLPAIREKWPRGNVQEVKHIRLQHDNAAVHFGKNDAEWIATTERYADRFIFTLKDQPAHSPDTNILDLGFFASIQSLQHRQTPANNIDELIRNVLRAWQQYDPKLLNRTFVTHQSVCDSIIVSHGDNDFDIPHMGKEALERQGMLPIVLPVSDVSKDVLLYLGIPP